MKPVTPRPPDSRYAELHAVAARFNGRQVVCLGRRAAKPNSAAPAPPGGG